MLLYLKVNTYYVNKIKCTADIGGGVRQVGVGGGVYTAAAVELPGTRSDVDT